MKLVVLLTWLFVLISDQFVHGSPGGAPPGACNSTVPNHGGTSQTCSTIYTIAADKSSFGQNDAVRITIQSNSAANFFRGILLIAKTQSSQQTVGTWSTTNADVRTLACGGIANTGITHSSRSDKTRIEAIWNSPATVLNETIVIRATIVKTYSEYYVDCYSVTLTARQENQSVITTTPTTTSNTGGSTPSTISGSTNQPATTTIANNNGGVNIGWTYANQATSVQMRFSILQPGQWGALGLSTDDQMGEDHVFICRLLNDGTVSLQRYINPGSYNPPTVVSNSDNRGGTFTVTRQSYDNGNVYCEFTLTNFDSSGRRRRQNGFTVLSQTAAYYPLIAIGNLGSSNEIRKHSSRSALSKTVQLNRQESIVDSGDSDDGNGKLAQAHGIIMLFAWILFVSTGILIAQFFKKAWPEQKICGKAAWFAIHRTMMLCAATFTITGFILILIFKKGKWISVDQPVQFAHSIFGIVVICFAVIQPIMAIFRCAPDAPNRFIFNYAHGIVGYSAFLFSIVTIFLAMFFPYFNFRENGEWGILVAWSCWVPIIFLIFAIVEFYFQNQARRNAVDSSYEMNNQTTHGQAKVETRNGQHNVMEDRIKTGLLIVHILVAVALSILLAVFIGRS